jgi:hypothetical protein
MVIVPDVHDAVGDGEEGVHAVSGRELPAPKVGFWRRIFDGRRKKED